MRERIESNYHLSKASEVMPVVKNLPASAGDAGDMGLSPGSGRSLGEGNGNPLQYSCLGNSHRQRRLTGYNPWGLDTTE